MGEMVTLNLPQCIPQRVHVTSNSISKYILLDVLLCSIAEYFYELCRILASP